MTAPLRMVQTPGDRGALIQQVVQLTAITAEHQIRGQVLASERRRVLRELYIGGMNPGEIATATGLGINDVQRQLKLGRRR